MSEKWRISCKVVKGVSDQNWSSGIAAMDRWWRSIRTAVQVRRKNNVVVMKQWLSSGEVVAWAVVEKRQSNGKTVVIKRWGRGGVQGFSGLFTVGNLSKQALPSRAEILLSYPLPLGPEKYKNI